MTGPLSSLTNRIFIATALLVVISTGVAIYRVNASLTARAEADLPAGLDEVAALVEEVSRTQFADFVVKASLIADLPMLKAAATTDHLPTVQPIADDYNQSMMRADLFVVTNAEDRVLAQAGRVRLGPGDTAQLFAACRANPDGTAFWVYPDGVVHAIAIPMRPPPLGTLLVGFSLDRSAADRFKAMTNSEIVLAVEDRVIASTLAAEGVTAVPSLVDAAGRFRGWIGSEEYIGRAQTLGSGLPTDPRAIVLRSRTDHLQFLPPLRWQLAITGGVAILIATLLGYGIARTVTRPLRAVTATMREIAATGDLGRAVPGVGRWDDEDARVLSTTFGQLTGALRRFQREAAQRERLSSLGRLSTVVAHEIRNPLMIIKSAARSLRRHPSPEVAAVAQSIDEEVNRLNNVVSGVLDFARPIEFSLAPADLVDIGRDASQAAAATAGDVAISFETTVPRAPVVIDAERLRAVLVNVLSNAQQAVRATGAAPPPPVSIRLASSRAGWWTIEVADRGEGISPEHLGRVFDPFFTTRRTGSGLGLAIARNVVEGLGGTISLESAPRAGTRVRIELPAGPAGGRPHIERPGVEVRA